MKKETLQKIGIKAKKDINANLLRLLIDDPDNTQLARQLSLTAKDMEKLRAIQEFVTEFATEKNKGETVINSAECALGTVLPLFDLENHEAIFIATLKSNNTLINIHKLQAGEVGKVNLSMRKLVQTALNDSAASIIIFHNHPSGNPSPSKGDIEITEKLHELMNTFGMLLLDHLIIGKDTYYSFTESKVMPIKTIES